MLADFRMSTIRLANGLSLPVVEHGDPAGTPVLLLHGITDSWRSFEPILLHLPRSIRAVAVTLRGHGDASKPREGYAMADFADDVIALLDTLGIARAVVLGHSMGSLVAQRVALDHPDRVAGLVLVGAFPCGRGNPELEALWEGTVSALQDPVDESFVWEFQSGTCAQPVPVGLLETAVQESLKVPAHVWREAFGALVTTDHRAELPRIAAPTLLLWGARDAIVGRADQDALLAIPGARLTAYREAGHAPHWEEPERFARDLAGFVASLETQAAA